MLTTLADYPTDDTNTLDTNTLEPVTEDPLGAPTGRPEGPRRPPMFRRLLAFGVDSFLGAGPLAASFGFLLFPFIAMMFYWELPAFYDSAFLFYGSQLLLLVSLPWLLFFGLCRDGFKGQSPGKRLVGLMVIQRDGQPCDMKGSLLRNILFMLIALFHWFLPIIGLLALLIEPAAVIIDPQGRRLGDKWAETQVVEKSAFNPGQT